MTEDRRMAQELRRLGTRDWQPPAGGAAAAVRTARRRTGAGVAGLAAAVAAVALTVPLALDADTVASPLPPAASLEATTPAPSSEPSLEAVAPTTAPPSAPPPATAAPSTPAVPVVAPSAAVVEPLVVPEPTDGPASAGTLAGLRVRDLEPGAPILDIPDVELRTLGSSWASDPCGDDRADGDEARTGFYSAVVPGDAALAWQAATYPRPADAQAALSALVEEVEACRTDVGSVWRVWAGSASEGAVTLVSYDVVEGPVEAGTVLPQWGEFYRLRLDGSTLVLSGRAGVNIGTGIAYALGDTRPEVGLAEFGLSRAEVEQLAGDRLPRFAQDVEAHLAGGSPGTKEP